MHYQKLLAGLGLATLLMGGTALASTANLDTIEGVKQRIVELKQELAELQIKLRILTLTAKSDLHDGDSVRARLSVNVRPNPSLFSSFTPPVRAPRDSTGVIRCDASGTSTCPTTSTYSSYLWWFIDWDDQSLGQGWSAELPGSSFNYLVKNTGGSPPPPPPPGPPPPPVCGTKFCADDRVRSTNDQYVRPHAPVGAGEGIEDYQCGFQFFVPDDEIPLRYGQYPIVGVGDLGIILAGPVTSSLRVGGLSYQVRWEGSTIHIPGLPPYQINQGLIGWVNQDFIILRERSTSPPPPPPPPGAPPIIDSIGPKYAGQTLTLGAAIRISGRNFAASATNQIKFGTALTISNLTPEYGGQSFAFYLTSYANPPPIVPGQTYQVTVTNANGTSNSFPVTFVAEPPPPTEKDFPPIPDPATVPFWIRAERTYPEYYKIYSGGEVIFPITGSRLRKETVFDFFNANMVFALTLPSFSDHWLNQACGPDESRVPLVSGSWSCTTFIDIAIPSGTPAQDFYVQGRNPSDGTKSNLLKLHVENPLTASSTATQVLVNGDFDPAFYNEPVTLDVYGYNFKSGDTLTLTAVPNDAFPFGDYPTYTISAQFISSSHLRATWTVPGPTFMSGNRALHIGAYYVRPTSGGGGPFFNVFNHFTAKPQKVTPISGPVGTTFSFSGQGTESSITPDIEIDMENGARMIVAAQNMNEDKFQITMGPVMSASPAFLQSSPDMPGYLKSFHVVPGFYKLHRTKLRAGGWTTGDSWIIEVTR